MVASDYSQGRKLSPEPSAPTPACERRRSKAWSQLFCVLGGGKSGILLLLECLQQLQNVLIIPRPGGQTSARWQDTKNTVFFSILKAPRQQHEHGILIRVVAMSKWSYDQNNMIFLWLILFFFFFLPTLVLRHISRGVIRRCSFLHFWSSLASYTNRQETLLLNTHFVFVQRQYCSW